MKQKFIAWLRTNGAEILPTTNSYEVVRFMAHGRVNIIYEGRRGIRAIGFAEECLQAFEAGSTLNMGFTQNPRHALTKRKVMLRQRDGDKCFFCGKGMFGIEGEPGHESSVEDCTIEHLVGRGKGGPDHDDNLALSHE